MRDVTGGELHCEGAGGHVLRQLGAHGQGGGDHLVGAAGPRGELPRQPTRQRTGKTTDDGRRRLTREKKQPYVCG